MSEQTEFALHFEQALLGPTWASDVRLGISANGHITEVATDGTALTHSLAGLKTTRVSGCAVPGIPNLHSHAHQRAMAGLAERAGTSRDSFWSWRERMYQHVGKLQPHQMQAVAAQLYVEMLKAGYTCVGEFQYLHHAPDGQPYENPAQMSLRAMAAARESGIAMTLLPVLYAYGGFGAAAPGARQRRFIHEPEAYLRLLEMLAGEVAQDAHTTLGIAPHSLRAVDGPLLSTVLAAVQTQPGLADCPVHIHIAEQQIEVQDCVATHGQRPVQWLLNSQPVDARWCLIHATHMSPEESKAAAATGAVIGLCPTTEANLGDGIFAAREYLAHGGRIGIGSDSHISVSPVEELRWLEYAQRLTRQQRNLLAPVGGGSTGRALFDQAVLGGAQACAQNAGVLAPGQRADIVVLDIEHPQLYGRRGDALLDSWIFSGLGNPVRDVYVAGRCWVEGGEHVNEQAIATQFKRAIDELSE